MGRIESRLLSWSMTALLGLISAIASYGVHLISGMSDNISELNQKVAVVITRTADQDQRIRDHESRLNDHEAHFNELVLAVRRLERRGR